MAPDIECQIKWLVFVFHWRCMALHCSWPVLTAAPVLALSRPSLGTHPWTHPSLPHSFTCRNAQAVAAFHASLPSRFPHGEPPPGSGNQAYFDIAYTKVAEVLSKRTTVTSTGNSVQYFIHWRNLPKDATGLSWETVDALSQDAENAAAIKQYESDLAAKQQQQMLQLQMQRAAAAPVPHAQGAVGGLAGESDADEEEEEEEDDVDLEEALEADMGTDGSGGIGASDSLLPLPQDLPGAQGSGAISDDNLFKLAVAQTVAEKKVQLLDLAAVVGVAHPQLSSWLTGRGRIDDHAEVELKHWLAHNAGPAWSQRLPDVMDCVANLRDRYTRKRLALRRSLGAKHVGITTKAGPISTPEMVGPEAPDPAVWEAHVQAGGQVYAAPLEALDMSPADGGPGGLGHLEQYAVVDHATLAALMEGMSALPEASRPVPPQSQPAPPKEASDSSTEEKASEAAGPPAPAEGEAGDEAQEAPDAASEGDQGEGGAGEDQPTPPPTEFSFNHFQRQLMALAGMPEAEVPWVGPTDAAEPPAAAGEGAGVTGGVPAFAIACRPQGSAAPQEVTFPPELVQAARPQVSASAVCIASHWIPRGMTQPEFQHFIVPRLAEGAGKEAAAVPAAVVQQLWDLYTSMDHGTRDGTVWLPDLPPLQVFSGAKTLVSSVPTPDARTKAMHMATAAPGFLPELPRQEASSASSPKAAPGLPALDAPDFAQASKRAAEDCAAREKKAAEIRAAAAQRSAQAARASASGAGASVSAQGSSQAIQRAAMAAALQALGPNAAQGFHARGFTPLIYPSHPNTVAIFQQTASGTVSHVANYTLAQARQFGEESLVAIMQLRAQQQAQQVPPAASGYHGAPYQGGSTAAM